jgi:hypothetical protein
MVLAGCGSDVLTPLSVGVVVRPADISSHLSVVQWKNGARGGAVVEALRYKPDDRGIDSPWCHWSFSLTTSWNPQGLSRPVMGLLCHYIGRMAGVSDHIAVLCVPISIREPGVFQKTLYSINLYLCLSDYFVTYLK